MNTLVEKAWELEPIGGVIDDITIKNLFPTLSEDACRSMIYRAISAGDLIRIRPGLYLLAEKFIKGTPINPFVLSQMIYWPSYISFESALRYHQLIPEHVPVVTAASSKRACRYDSDYGVYSYTRIVAKSFFAGVEWISLLEGQIAQIAAPLRAIGDLVYFRKEISWKKDGLSFLTKSLRVEMEDLLNLDLSFAKETLFAFRNKRVVEYLEKLINEISK